MCDGKQKKLPDCKNHRAGSLCAISLERHWDRLRRAMPHPPAETVEEGLREVDDLLKTVPWAGAEAKGLLCAHLLREPCRDTATKPVWDPELRVLSLGDEVVKRFRQPARNQELVLAAFQEEGWPERIDDPIPPHGEVDARECLHWTIEALNNHQEKPLIGFFGDGTGKGVCWAPARGRSGTR
jgi:hypothetical protein